MGGVIHGRVGRRGHAARGPSHCGGTQRPSVHDDSGHVSLSQSIRMPSVMGVSVDAMAPSVSSSFAGFASTKVCYLSRDPPTSASGPRLGGRLALCKAI